MTFEKVVSMIAHQLRMPADSIRKESRFKEDLNADSANVMMLIIDLEQEFGITVDDDALGEIKTVGDVVGYIEKAKKA